MFLLVVAPACCEAGGGNLFARLKNAPAEPTLYIANENKEKPTFLAVSDVNKPARCADNLLIVTHGWLEKTTWPADLAAVIQTKVDPNEWLCGFYDWRRQADCINPTDAAKFAKETAGPRLAETILKPNPNFKHIHLIGHSAGAWLVSEAAETIAKQTTASIHLTFLDAYVPPFWNEDELGSLANDPNVTYWADHYLTRDITLGTTQKKLTHAHNIDITKADPDISDHQFAWNWYQATVTGQYAKGRKYHGKKLLCVLGETEYGFARSFEAGGANWQRSRSLKLGATRKLSKPKINLRQQLEELFKKRSK